MARLIYSAITSLDGYVEDTAGAFDWSAPDDEVLAFVNDLERPIETYLYGRRMYETMKYWETASIDAGQTEPKRDFARIWRAAEKVVYSRTLPAPTTVHTRLERSFDQADVRRLKQSSTSDLSIGGGKPVFPLGVRLRLEPLDEHRFSPGPYLGAVSMSANPGPRWLPDIGQVLLFGVLALVFVPIGWVSVREGGVTPRWTTVLLVTLVVLHLTVLAARWRPVGAFAIGSLCMLLLVVAPDLGGRTAVAAGSDYSPLLLPSSLCFLALLYAVSARKPWPWPTTALGVGLLGGVLITVRLWGFTVAGLAVWAWQLMQVTVVVTGTVAAWALGRFVSVRTAWVAELAERGAADERRRIAREMHDVVAHSLAVVVSHAEAGRLVVVREPERAPAILDTIAGTGREALTEMRGLLGVLRGSSGDAAPAAAEPQPGLTDLPALINRVRATGQRVDFEPPDLPQDMSPAVGLTAYRVVQEALTNVTRHAGPGAAARVTVTRDRDDLVIEVTDDGITAVDTAPGRGLIGMRERVETVGGELDSGPAERGWQIRARLPWEGAAREHR